MGQAPSAQDAHRLHWQNRDAGLEYSSKMLQASQVVRTAPSLRKPAYFCEFCDRPDRSFVSKFALEEHLKLHNPAYGNVVDRRREAKREAKAQRLKEQPLASSFCRVCDKDYGFGPEKLLDHYVLAEKHRSIRTRSDLHPTDYKPQLWCAICQTRFTHSDRKRKHMEEMNNHNLHYRELEARALRVPGFDRSILERPSFEEVKAMEESTRFQHAQQARAQEVGSSTSSRTIAGMSTGTAPEVRMADYMAEDDNSLHYCAPCDRYFLSADELALHQSETLCTISVPVLSGPATQRHSAPSANSRGAANVSDSTATGQSLPSQSLPATDRSPILRATQPMQNVTIPEPSPAPVLAPRPAPPRSPSPPPFPPPPYEEEDGNAPLAATVSNSSTVSGVALGTAPTSTSSDSGGPGVECSLCLEREDNLSSLACGHIFGTGCIRETLEEDPRCPICREPASLSDLRRVFLT